ncbi:MAG: hypothetical protein M3R38_18220 [Actinomycetota bacterium]|nr:hypothetical protein [Actinomycetota bacterium]
MDPATHCLAILRPQPEHLWDRLKAVLQAQDGPLIAVARQDGTGTFQAETWGPILQARVAEALDAVWQHGEAWRAFGPVG